MTFMHLPFDKMFANKSSENKKGMQFQKGDHSISLLPKLILEAIRPLD